MHLGIIKITYNRTAQPRCFHNAFYGRLFLKHRRECNSDFAMTIWPFWISNWLCFVISLSICYWLFKCGVLRFVCECESVCVCVCVYVCVCVCEIEREGHRAALCVCVCVCMCEREGDKVTQPRLVYKHIQASSPCLSRDSVPFSAWTDAKTKDIIDSLYIYSES